MKINLAPASYAIFVKDMDHVSLEKTNGLILVGDMIIVKIHGDLENALTMKKMDTKGYRSNRNAFRINLLIRHTIMCNKF
jgi:hypothetical protein